MSTEDIAILKAKLNQETARITWPELQRFFANGSALAVHSDLDLLDVAVAMTQDHAERIKGWLDAGQLGPVSDQQALDWHEQNPPLWALVIKPWVLVQAR